MDHRLMSQKHSQATRPESPGDLLVLQDVSVLYQLRTGLLSARKVDVLAVDRVSLSIKRGQTLGLVGGTGSGKSTIAHAVIGLVEPTTGRVMINGRDVGQVTGNDRLALRRHVQVVLQDPYSSLDPRMTVGDVVAEPLTLGRRLANRVDRAKVDDRVAELLGLVGLSAGKAGLYPNEFSGGQRQRIAIARALGPEPELIVLDEPTSALDVSVRAQILNLLKSLQHRLDVTYLIISHDLVTVTYLASMVAVMFLGRIVEIGPTQALYKLPRHPYTLELIASVPGASGSFLNQPRPTQATTPLPPKACRFAHRCALRTALGDPVRCLEEDPALVQVGTDHLAACHFPDSTAELAHNIASAAPLSG